MLGIFRNAKHRINKRRINGHVRHHHHDVFGFQCGIMLKRIKQAIVQNLQLADFAVTGMNLEGTIGRRDGALHLGCA